jgi:ATP-dependent protease ClpP protease subunit
MLRCICCLYSSFGLANYILSIASLLDIYATYITISYNHNTCGTESSLSMTTSLHRFESVPEAMAFTEATSQILVYGDFNSALEEQIIACLQHAKMLGLPAVTLLIDSFGGDTNSLNSIISVLKDSPVRHVGVVMGAACSSAMLLLQGCDYRMAQPLSTMLCHWGGVSFGNTELAALMRGDLDPVLTVIQLRQSLFDTIQQRATCSPEILREYHDDEKLITAKIALELGLIDEIIQGRYDQEDIFEHVLPLLEQATTNR